jgi:Protein tyrosine and serine/threonine kinase
MADTEPDLSEPDQGNDVTVWLASLCSDRGLEIIGPSQHRTDTFTVIEVTTRHERDLWIVSRSALRAGTLEVFKELRHVMARLSHPHLLAIYDGGVHDGQPYLLMQHFTGQSLRERIGSQPLPVIEAVEHAISMARAVHFMHEAGLVGLDLNTNDVLLPDDTGLWIDLRAKLKQRVDESGADDLLAQIGYPEGMNPKIAGAVVDRAGLRVVYYGLGLSLSTGENLESIRDMLDESGRREDVRTLGAILYEMLTGRPPWGPRERLRSDPACSTILWTRDSSRSACAASSGYRIQTTARQNRWRKIWRGGGPRQADGLDRLALAKVTGTDLALSQSERRDYEASPVSRQSILFKDTTAASTRMTVGQRRAKPPSMITACGEHASGLVRQCIGYSVGSQTTLSIASTKASTLGCRFAGSNSKALEQTGSSRLASFGNRAARSWNARRCGGPFRLITLARILMARRGPAALGG